ncbi:MAG: sensor histidine kinase [Mesorhizobium sp.]|uniref:sensor histidine kinase n=1 Tax=Mesorhizobium sp. TaxID=1871066 RepID=UPI000FE63CD7|nr:sensor histidine kinase [Mesorhizobium sp.]RWP58197.1 MAG: sensor histidine kinase [Mesorhizobium sp.]TIM26356.1 MAG: sensor histidine kinase [Mesorhizobium sp.]
MLCDPPVRSRRRAQNVVRFLVAILIAIFLDGGSAAAEIVGRSPRVLILHPYDEWLPASAISGANAKARLQEATAGKIDLFSEYLDQARFPERAHIDRMARSMADKYVDRRPDVVIALGESATRFIVEHREAIAPDAKIVFGGFGRDSVSKLNLPVGVVGAFSEFDIAKTLELASALQPDAENLFIIGGSAAFDRTWLANARRDLADAAKDYETTYLEGLAIDEFAERASRFPADSIVLFLTILADGTGRNFLSKDALAIVAAKASAPIYGPYDTYIGQGVVGGNSVTFESLGNAVAGLALDALAGKPITDIEVPQTFFADARQLKRWDLSESALPAGTALSFKQPDIWQQYRRLVLGIIAVVALQAAIITGLLVERRRRFAAEGESRLRLLELVHMNQSATAGALSASIAHELNQPLGAILSNAEAAEAILKGKTPDLNIIQQILADIKDDDQRAGNIILRLRGLLKKRNAIDWQEFDLNEVVDSSINILHAEAAKKQVAVSAEQSKRRLPVRADMVHLQQVILNLATNAIDAMVEASTAERKLVLQTTLYGDTKVEMSISDTGRGIPKERLDSIFDAFYTTKPNGTGLGLSIARAIVETYGGKIWADNRAGGGAVFRFVLPLAQAV